MSEVILNAVQASLVQNQMSLRGLKQNAEYEQAIVDMLAKAQQDLAKVTPTRGQVVNITV